MRRSRLGTIGSQDSISSKFIYSTGLHSSNFLLPIIDTEVVFPFSATNSRTESVQCEDWKDESHDPSYALFEFPYDLKCRRRYRASQALYEKTFKNVIHQLIEEQPSACEAVRFIRHMSITTLWPPMHTRKELDYVRDNFFSFTEKERKRLNVLINTKIQ